MTEPLRWMGWEACLDPNPVAVDDRRSPRRSLRQMRAILALAGRVEVPWSDLEAHVRGAPHLPADEVESTRTAHALRLTRDDGLDSARDGGPVYLASNGTPWRIALFRSESSAMAYWQTLALHGWTAVPTRLTIAQGG